MGLNVNTNVASLNSQRQLFSSSNLLSKAFEQLSSGFRINRASDDAAGLQISDRLTSQIQGLNQAVRNANDGISVAQTAEGALSETTQNLQRIRQLAVQAQNGINSNSDKAALNKEATQLLNEINRIADETQFGGKNLLDGNFSSQFLVGANSGQSIDVGLTQFSAGFGIIGLGVQGLDITTGLTASGVSSNGITGASGIGTQEVFISDATLTNGTYTFAVSGDGGNTYTEVSADYTGSSMGFISDIGVKIQNASGATLGVLASSGNNLWLQNGDPDFRIAALDTNPSNLDPSGKTGSYNSSSSLSSSGGGTTSVLDTIDGAMSRVNGVRADLGATQNRFQSSIRNLSSISENLSSSRSTIMDTDYASDTAELTRQQIIQQASLTVLGQANQRPQSALSLLG